MAKQKVLSGEFAIFSVSNEALAQCIARKVGRRFGADVCVKSSMARFEIICDGGRRTELDSEFIKGYAHCIFDEYFEAFGVKRG